MLALVGVTGACSQNSIEQPSQKAAVSPQSESSFVNKEPAKTDTVTVTGIVNR